MDKHTLSRRTLLKVLGQGALVASALTGLPLQSLAGVTNRSGRRLILVELSGANDGLNTVVPYADDRYHELRPSLGLKRNEIISINDNLGFHQALQQMMPIWQSGELAVVQGLGYPHPNRSHFSSIQLWETGGDGIHQKRDGWLTHDIEHRYPSQTLDAHGICLDGRMGVFESERGNWLSMNSATQFNDVEGLAAYETSTGNPSLDAVLASGRTLKASVDAIASRMEKAKLTSNIRDSKLADQMNHVVNLINAGTNVPVLKVSLGGFDTHEGQRWRHSQLMKSLGNALGGLRRELRASGEWDETLVMTYSEFGRRAGENRSGGTDHGTASVHFVMGGRVQGGLYGQPADLGELVNGDLVHTTDYRALYHEVLAGWLDLPDNRFTGYKDSVLNRVIAG